MPLARLTRRAEFVRMNAHARKAATPGLVLQVLRHDRPGTPGRIGFTVTKKVGDAVTRNRARRRLREAARLLFADTPPAGFDLVLIGRDGTVRRPWSALQGDLVAALRRVHGAAPGDPPRPERGER